MDTLFQDVRYSVRKLLRTPGFTIVAVVTLALAVGATTAIFSVVNGVLLKPLPFRDPARLVLVSSTNRDGKMNAMSALDYIDYRDQSHGYVGMAQTDVGNVNLARSGTPPTRLNAARVGARFFELLGVRPELGRAFVAGDDATGAPRIAILSDALWRGRFGADSQVVGRLVSLDGQQYTVVGVAPPSLTFPRTPDVWLPYVWQPWEMDPENRGAHSIQAIARVKPGVTIESAQREISAIAERLAKQYPESNTGFGGMVQPLQEQMVGRARPALLAMLGASAFVLLIACANVANLLLVRAAARESEIAVRTALGAGRARLMRQIVTESVLLSAAGAAIGALLATWAVDAVVAFGPRGLPRLDEVAVDGRVLAFTAVVALATGIVFGLVPALHVARPDISQMLRESVRGSSRGGVHRTRSLLVASEMALAVVLLVGAGLLLRSFARLTHVDPGFRTARVVSFKLTMPDTKYAFDRQKINLVSQLSDQLRSMPGTEAVAVTFGRPLDRIRFRTTFDIAGLPPSPPEKRMVTEVRTATADYFRTLGIPLRRGRLYTADEDRPGAQLLVVSEEFARRYFKGEDPVGKRITLGISHDTAGDSTQVTSGGEIVGVVGDVKQGDLAEEEYPAAYVPYNSFPLGDAAVLVRTAADPAALERAAPGIVRALDADMPVYDVRRMDDVVAESVSQPRFYTMLLGGFAAIALLLAAVGIYGVISYVVSLRTRELGIRVALGASRGRILSLVLGQGLALTLAGVAVGLAAAFWLTRVIASLLFGVSALDPLTYAGVSLVLLAVAVLASYVPARRAARVDPVLAMRNDG